MSKRRKVLTVRQHPDKVAKYQLSCGHWVTVLNDDGKHTPKYLLCKQCSC